MVIRASGKFTRCGTRFYLTGIEYFDEKMI